MDPISLYFAYKRKLILSESGAPYTSDQWRNVMFSDEAKFETINSRSVTVMRSKTMNQYADKYVMRTVKHSPSDDVGLFQRQIRQGRHVCPVQEEDDG
jgi:hypothetical protein